MAESAIPPLAPQGPAEVFSLAECLCDEMQARGWTTTDVALRMGDLSVRGFGVNLLTVDLLMCVQDDNLRVGDDMFAALARAFDVSEEYLRNMDAYWREWPDRRSQFAPPESIFGPISRRAVMRVVK